MADEALQATARQYAPYCTVDTPEHRAALERTAGQVDGLLARLDEFQGVVHTIGTNRTELLEEILPILKTNCEGLEALFLNIEALEAFVQYIKQSVQQMETEVRAFEEQSSLIPLRGVFKQLRSVLKKPTARKGSQPDSSVAGAAGGDAGITSTKPGPGSPDWQPPRVFQAGDFFLPQEDPDKAT
eukprot:m.298675 g.298675  ORF g.298675 m.298675 type:complete len:185 (+) comp13927_c0_seq1:187-741(+)